MTKRLWSRVASTIVAGTVACAMVAIPAPADQDDFEIFQHFTRLADGEPVGVGADGSLVFFATEAALSSNEDLITSEDLEEMPFLNYNGELFLWNPSVNGVKQFTTTASILNEDSDAYLRETSNVAPVVSSKTVNVFKTGQERPDKEIVYAVAFLSDAQQEMGGPSVSIDEVDDSVAALDGGKLLYVWDTELEEFLPVRGTNVGVGSETADVSVAMDLFRDVNKIKGHKDDVVSGHSIDNVFVAFSSTIDPTFENSDGNEEIFLWDRAKFLQSEDEGEDRDNGGLLQVTDSIWDFIYDESDNIIGTHYPSNRLPAVSRRGDVAFVSDADYTGENPDFSDEIFVWNARRGFRQITDLTRGDIDTMAWSENGNTLVVGSTADITRRNPDENSEIFIWNRRKWKQVTRTIEGRNSNPSIDPKGRKIAFLSTSPLFGIPKDNEIAEVVIGRRGGRRFVQVTDTIDTTTWLGDDVLHESPRITRKGKKLSVIFVSNGDFVGRNSIGSRRVYIAPLN